MSGTDTQAAAVSRPLLITLGAVLVVAAAAYVLLIWLPERGDQTLASEPGVVAAPPDGAVDGATASEPVAEPTEIAGVEPTFQVFSARDPFDQLVAEDTGGSVGDTQDTAAPAGTTLPPAQTSPTAPTAPGDDDPVELPPAPVTGDPARTTVGATTIMLEEIFSDGGVDTALVLVNDEGYEATEGETVAGDLTVLDIEGSCATMRFDGRRFILCEGEQIRK